MDKTNKKKVKKEAKDQQTKTKKSEKNVRKKGPILTFGGAS